MRGWFWVVLVVAVLALAMLAGWLLGERAQSNPRRWAEAEMIQMETQRQQEEAGYFADSGGALRRPGGGRRRSSFVHRARFW